MDTDGGREGRSASRFQIPSQRSRSANSQRRNSSSSLRNSRREGGAVPESAGSVSSPANHEYQPMMVNLIPYESPTNTAGPSQVVVSPRRPPACLHDLRLSVFHPPWLVRLPSIPPTYLFSVCVHSRTFLRHSNPEVCSDPSRQSHHPLGTASPTIRVFSLPLADSGLVPQAQPSRNSGFQLRDWRTISDEDSSDDEGGDVSYCRAKQVPAVVRPPVHPSLCTYSLATHPP